MLKIHMTVDDLARLRIVPGVGPVLEGVFALQVFAVGGGSAAFQGWRKDVRAALGPRVVDVEHLLRRVSPVPELLWLARRDAVGVPPGGLTAATRRQVAPLVMDFCRTAVGSCWPAVGAHLQDHRELRSRAVLAGGLDALLGSLHPSVSWQPPVLRIQHRLDAEIRLDGRGLVLMPSLFLTDQVCLMTSQGDHQELTLAFPVPLGAGTAAVLQLPVEAQEAGLQALVGCTRAAALQIIAETCTTGELAERLGGSLAGASQHAKVLRNAGLITTARNRNTSLHALTSLGTAILQGTQHGGS